MWAIGTSDINTTGAVADMTDMVVYWYSTGRPTKITFRAPFSGERQAEGGSYYIDVGGTPKIYGAFNHNDASYSSKNTDGLAWRERLAAGVHTIKIRWLVTAGTLYQDGANDGNRILVVEEDK
jgi:hypothetical protein